VIGIGTVYLIVLQSIGKLIATESKRFAKLNFLSIHVADTCVKTNLFHVGPDQKKDSRLCFIYKNNWKQEVLFVRTEFLERACDRFKEYQAYSVIIPFNFEQQRELSIQWP
jgi:hypothetical protein